MTKWDPMPLSSIVERVIDYRGKTPPRSDVGIPTISAKHVKRGKVEHCGERFVSADTYSAWTTRGLIRPGDVLITTEAPVAEVARVPADRTYLITRRVIALQIDPAKACERFIMYSMLAEPHRRALANLGHGATVPRVFKEDILDFEIPMPPLDTQQVVGATLGAFDDLIENNRRRIEILEEMARLLYREWFVHFRFPGHEGVDLVDSELGPIPEGWERVAVSEIAEVVRGRSYRKAELVEDGGLPFLNLKCIDRGGGFRKSGLKRYDGKYKTAQETYAGDIVVAVTDMTQQRMIVGQAGRVPVLDSPFGIISLDLARVVPNEGVDREYLYGHFRYSSFSRKVKEFANGTNVLHLSPDRIKEHEFALAPGPLRDEYGDRVSPLYGLADNLSRQIDVLREARDLLLPRLVSGELDVSELELDGVLA